jgi:hypothetical protein
LRHGECYQHSGHYGEISLGTQLRMRADHHPWRYMIIRSKYKICFLRLSS